MRNEIMSINAGWLIDGSGALLLGQPQAGQLMENIPATFIAVKGDPSQLPESLNRLKTIFIKGKQINIDSYNTK